MLKILRQGLHTSIQDQGRYGYQKYGVIVSGTMDSYAHRLANLLVGNELGEGVLEMTLLGPAILFEEDALLAITGADMQATIAGKSVPMWRPVYVKKGAVLEFKSCQTGCRSYLAVAGGFAVPKVMGSKSTYLRAELGGFKGRILRDGDVIPLGVLSEQAESMMKRFKSLQQEHPFAATTWYANKPLLPKGSETIKIRVTPGRQFIAFTSDSKEQFFREPFQVTTQSDRMGYRLSGKPLLLTKPLEMISEAVALGTVQVPPDGQPIILLADRQTAGGYPKIAQVVTVDVDLLAQTRPGQMIQFELISLAEAEQLYFEREMMLQKIKQALTLRKEL